MSLPWSLSKLGTFETCRAKFKFKYIERLPEQRSVAADRGVNKHKLIEDYINGISVSLPPEYSMYQGFLSNLKNMGMQAEVKMALNDKWEPVPYDAPNVWWRGVLDAIIVQGNRANVYDWKTGKIYDDHDDQKDLYSSAVIQTHPEVEIVNATHVYVDLGKNRNKIYARHDIPTIREKWEARVGKMLEAQEYFPNPNFKCTWCGYGKSKGGQCKFG